MKPSEVEFLRRLIADKATRRALGAISARVLDQEGIGRLSGASIHYTETDHKKAADLLKSRGFLVQTPPAGQPRSAAAGSGSEKDRAKPVQEDLVAVVPMNIPGELQAPPGGFLALPWRHALQLPYDVLLVVENLEPILQISDFSWLGGFIKGRSTLVLFRGKPHIFNTEAAANVIADRERRRPTLGFFDFDPKGLAMASSLPRREALCLPDWGELEVAVKAARRSHLFSQSHDVSRAQLDKETSADIALAWKRMRGLAWGLNQEGFPR